MVKIGDLIEIKSMEGEPDYDGRCGIVEHIDDIGQLHGTWGGLAVVPEVDRFVVLKSEKTMRGYEVHPEKMF